MEYNTNNKANSFNDNNESNKNLQNNNNNTCNNKVLDNDEITIIYENKKRVIEDAIKNLIKRHTGEEVSNNKIFG